MEAQRHHPTFQGCPGHLLLHTAVWGGGPGFISWLAYFPFFIFERNLATFSYCQRLRCKAGESLFLSGLISADFQEITEHSGSPAPKPVYLAGLRHGTGACSQGRSRSFWGRDGPKWWPMMSIKQKPHQKHAPCLIYSGVSPPQDLCSHPERTVQAVPSGLLGHQCPGWAFKAPDERFFHHHLPLEPLTCVHTPSRFFHSLFLNITSCASLR